MFHLHNWERSAAARAVVVIGMVAFLAFGVGCMNLSFGGKHDTISTSDPLPTQKGTAYLRAGEVVRVYYPVPFQSPPNLQFADDSAKSIQIVDQNADYFSAKSTSAFGSNVNWEARGVKIAANTAPTQPSTSTNPTAPDPKFLIHSP